MGSDALHHDHGSLIAILDASIAKAIAVDPHLCEGCMRAGILYGSIAQSELFLQDPDLSADDRTLLEENLRVARGVLLNLPKGTHRR